MQGKIKVIQEEVQVLSERLQKYMDKFPNKFDTEGKQNKMAFTSPNLNKQYATLNSKNVREIQQQKLQT